MYMPDEYYVIKKKDFDTFLEDAAGYVNADIILRDIEEDIRINNRDSIVTPVTNLRFYSPDEE